MRLDDPERESLALPTTCLSRPEQDSKSLDEEDFQPSWSPVVTGGKTRYSETNHFSNDLQLLIRDKDSYDGRSVELNVSVDSFCSRDS